MEAFLNAHRTNKSNGQTATHTLIGNESESKGSYHIPDSDLPKLNALLLQNIKEGKELKLTEINHNGGLFVIDIDLKYPQGTERQFTDLDTIRLCEYATKAIKELSPDTKELKALVLTRPEPYVKDDITKDGIHVIFNITSHTAERHAIRQKIITALKQDEEWCEIKKTTQNNWEGIVDDAVCRQTAWIMMGCTSKTGQIPYQPKIELVWDDIADHEDHDIITNPDDDYLPITSEMIDEYQVRNNKLHPALKTTIEKETLTVKKRIPRGKTTKKVNQPQIEDTPTYLAELAKLLPVKCINDPRLARNIASCFRSCGGKDVARELFSKSEHAKPNYDEWFENWYESNPITTGRLNTLNYHARNANGTAHRELLSRHKTISLDDACNPMITDKDFATQLNAVYQGEVMVTPEGVYHFNGVNWSLDEKDKKLQAQIMKVLPAYYDVILNQTLADHLPEDATDEDKKARQSVISKIRENRKKLGMTSQVRNIASAFRLIAEEVEEPEWERQIHHFVFKDRVFDMERGDWINPSPDDNMLLNTGYNWVEPSDDDREFVKKLVEETFPEEDERNYYCRVICSGLCSNHTRTFAVCSGTGSNGKGMLHTLASKMLGDGKDAYFSSLPVQALSHPISDDKPNPAIAKLNYKRMVVTSEPQETGSGSSINPSTIKQLVSGDGHIDARMLHSNKMETKLRSTLIMECNTKPDWNGSVAEAERKRLKNIPFRSQFCKNTEYQAKMTRALENQESGDTESHLQPKYIHRADDKMKTRVENERGLACAYFEYLMPHYKKWMEMNMSMDDDVPESIIKATNEYADSSDFFQAWFDETFEKATGCYVKSTELWVKFKQYAMLTRPKANQKNWSTQTAFKKWMQNKPLWVVSYYGNGGKHIPAEGRSVKNIIYGYRLKDCEYEEQPQTQTDEYY